MSKYVPLSMHIAELYVHIGCIERYLAVLEAEMRAKLKESEPYSLENVHWYPFFFCNNNIRHCHGHFPLATYRLTDVNREIAFIEVASSLPL